MNEELIVVAVATGALFVFLLGFLVLFAKLYRRVRPSEALVVTTPNGTRVFKNGGIVFPFVQSAEVIDLSVKKISCACSGRDAVATRDGTRVDVEAAFTLRVGDTTEQILEAAKKIGAARIRDAKALDELFGGRFARAISDVVAVLDYAELERERERLEDEVTKIAAEDLQGLVLDRVVVARIEPTPPDAAGPFR